MKDKLVHTIHITCTFPTEKLHCSKIVGVSMSPAQSGVTGTEGAICPGLSTVALHTCALSDTLVPFPSQGFQVTPLLAFVR